MPLYCFTPQFSDTAQGFAVPTPKVPLLPFLNGPKTNGTGQLTPPQKQINKIETQQYLSLLSAPLNQLTAKERDLTDNLC